MHKPFIIHSYSISKQNKTKNGDGFISKILKDENLLLAIVADGVSQQPCDWKASKIVCESILQLFEESRERNLEKRLIESVSQANQILISEQGKCQKMASTLSLFLWDFNSSKFHICNVGDSRIYRVSQDSIECLTKDDSIVKREFVSTSKSTQRIESQMLNRVMGQDDLKILIENHVIQNKDFIILATDGFYDARKASFSKKMIELANAEDHEESFTKMIKSFEIFRGDDFTVIAIWIL